MSLRPSIPLAEAGGDDSWSPDLFGFKGGFVRRIAILRRRLGLRKQDRLDRARADAQMAYPERRRAAEAAVVEARKAYRAAGGQA